MGELKDAWQSLFRVKQKAAAERVCPDHRPQIGELAPKQGLDESYGLVNGIKGNTSTPPSKAGANTSMPRWDKALSAVPSTSS